MGNKVIEETQKLEVFQEYFQALFTDEAVEATEIYKFLERLPVPKLAEDHVSYLNSAIGQDEIKMTIEAMKPKTAPCPDGCTVEYYK